MLYTGHKPYPTLLTAYHSQYCTRFTINPKEVLRVLLVLFRKLIYNSVFVIFTISQRFRNVNIFLEFIFCFRNILLQRKSTMQFAQCFHLISFPSGNINFDSYLHPINAAISCNSSCVNFPVFTRFEIDA